MKTSEFFAISCMVLAMACSKEAPVQDEVAVEIPQEIGTMVFEASTEAVKTSLVPDGDLFHVVWSAGDRIDINGTVLEIETGSQPSGYGPGERKARFTGLAPRKNNTSPFYKAIYPASFRDNYGYYNLPAEQSYVADNISAYPMYAENDEGTLNFKHLCGIVRVGLKGDKSVTSIALADKGAEPKALSGRSMSLKMLPCRSPEQMGPP